VSELEKLREAVLLFCDGLDSVVTKLRQDLGAEAKTETFNLRTEHINWSDQQGTKGPYQRSDDFDSRHHKELLKWLASKDGRARRKDGFFYWTFENGSTIGRKLMAGGK